MICLVVGYNVWMTVCTDIVIPLVSAAIGGGLTLLGVWFTLRNQTKKEERQRRLNVKPILLSYDKRRGLCNESLQVYRMEIGGTLTAADDPFATVYIKNTDNGVACLNRIETENNQYFPSCGNIVEKNELVQVVVVLANDCTETLKKPCLIVDDIYGNSYKYELLAHGTEFILGDCTEM